ncbi:MAG: fluoride efflux transporter CrcB [Termitinemataceae bacterium]|nr:MAG: fluoride efflux transporter CrcB [Termitinemataceae bacterium]
MKNSIYIVLGGGAGALLRYIVNRISGGAAPANIPAATLIVNCIGALCAGFFFCLFEGKFGTERLRFFLVTGFLGAFTTFSAFSLESARLFLGGIYASALLNILLNNILCILAVFAGIWLYNKFF